MTTQKLSTNLQKIPKHHLNNYLRYFYSDLKTVDGKFYSPPSLVCFRAALHRYFQTIRDDVNIITDSTFDFSNRMLKAMVKKYKESNQPKEEEAYPVIEAADMLRLYHYFDRSSPAKLQEEVMFNFLYYFLLRGRETLPHFNKDSFIIETDSNGKKYVRIQCELLSKNAKASLIQKEYESIQNARMYENDDQVNCPVHALELYFTKLPNSCLFPKPFKNKRFAPSNLSWYCGSKVIGKHTIGNLLKNLSTAAGLSKRYTNHCVRVTAISILKENGKTNEEIAQYSGHKNPQSVQRYCRKRRENEKCDVSNILSAGMTEQAKSLPIGKYGKVVVKENINIGDTTTIALPGRGFQRTEVPSFKINFNGNFNQCTFQTFTGSD